MVIGPPGNTVRAIDDILGTLGITTVASTTRHSVAIQVAIFRLPGSRPAQRRPP